MNKPFRATHVLAGVVLPTARPGVLTHAEGRQHARRKARRGRCVVAAKRSDDTSLWIAEPLRFHRARYEHLTRPLQGKCHLAAAVLSCLILIMLAWKSENGGFISPERWLCGGLSGWFIVSMCRLALFTCLAAPRFICHARGKLRLSGLGSLRPEQILHWSIKREVAIHACDKPGARIHLCCRWLGWERHWTMLLEEGPETERLQRLLEAEAPRTADPAALRMHQAIPIEAGILSQ